MSNLQKGKKYILTSFQQCSDHRHMVGTGRCRKRILSNHNYTKLVRGESQLFTFHLHEWLKSNYSNLEL